MLPDVAGDQPDALGVLGDKSETDALLLQLLALLVGQIDEPAVEQDVDLGLVDRPLGLPAFVEDRHSGAVAHGVVDSILVEVGLAGLAEAGVGVLVGLLDGRAGEAEEASLGQRRLEEGTEVLLLRAVALVHQHNPVLRVRDRFLRALELEDGREQDLARPTPRNRLAQSLHVARLFGVGQAAGDESLGYLVVQINPVGQYENVGVLERGRIQRQMGLQLQGQEHHRQALARPLCVPDQALLLFPLGDAIHRLVDGSELLIAADLLDRLSGVGTDLKDDKVGQKVQESRGLQ